MSIDISEKDEEGRPKLMDEKIYPKLLSTQQAIASSVFSTTARVNEGNLRAAQTDRLQRVLDALREDEAGDAETSPDPSSTNSSDQDERQLDEDAAEQGEADDLSHLLDSLDL